MTTLAKINLAAAVGLPLLYAALQSTEELTLLVPLSLVMIALVLLIPALNTLASIASLFRLTLGWRELLSGTSAAGLFLIPALLSLVPTPPISHSPMLLFSMVYLSIAILILVAWRFPVPSLPQPLTKARLRSLLPLLGMTALYLVVISTIVLTYPVLPDKDPYTWLDRFEQFFNSPDGADLQRPLFYYFVRVTALATGLETYAIFKYVLPYLPLLALPLLWLPAARLPSRIAQVVILGIPAFSASSLLYFTTPMPQQFSMVVTVGAVAWLAYAAITRRELWGVAAAILAAAGSLYHETALIVSVGLLAGLGLSMLHRYRTLVRYVHRHPAVLILLLALLVTNAPRIHAVWEFGNFWFHRVVLESSLSPNLQFPAQYQNIDGNEVGWQGIEGVIKYYAYYVGPPILLLLALYIWRLIVRPLTWATVRQWFRSPSTLAALLAFVPFFSIAEVLPRVANIALLPERAWIFAGFITTFPLLAAPYFRELKRSRWIWSLLLVLTLISTSGGLYVNWLKRYVAPLSQWQSIEWIRRELPHKRRIVASPQFANLLTFHAASDVVPVGVSQICVPAIAERNYLRKLITEMETAKMAQREKRAYTAQLAAVIDTEGDIPLEQIERFRAELTDAIAEQRLRIMTDAHERPLYFFYAAPDPRNPYAGRPYALDRYGEDSCIVETLNQHPDLFKPVHTDQRNQANIIIWEVL